MKKSKNYIPKISLIFMTLLAIIFIGMILYYKKIII